MELRLLGPVQVRRTDGSVVEPHEWRTAKTLDLLRLLGLNNGMPVTTGSIIDKLWPDVDEARGRASLRTATSQLRKVLRSDSVERRGGSLVLSGAWVDAAAYEALLEEVEASRRMGDHSRTVALVQEAEAIYLGDLDVPDSSGDWLRESCRGLRELRCRALLDAADAASALCWMRDSLDFARRAAALDMCEESARALMRALAAVGEIQKALEVFEVLRRDLVDTYGVDPSPQTRALHLQLLTGTAARTQRRRYGAHIGHDATIDDLAMEMCAMLRDEPGAGIVWLTGDAGSGRHSVVETACRQVGLSWHDMSRDLWTNAAPSSVAGAWVLPDTDVVVMPLAESAPPHAVKLLGTLARQHGGILVVPVRHAPADLLPCIDGVPHRVISVGPVSQEELAELSAMVLQGTPSSRLLRLLRAESGGLSGAACSALRTWLNAGRIVWSADGLELASAAPSEDTRVDSGPLRRRLRLLSAFGEDVVQAVAVAGGEADPLEVAGVVLALRRGGSVEEVRTSLDQLVDLGLLSCGSAGYSLRSEHMRADVLASMRPQARQQLHRLVADEITMPFPERIAHLIDGGQHQRAAVLGLAALEQAQSRGAGALAAELVTILGRLPEHVRRQCGVLDQRVVTEGVLRSQSQSQAGDGLVPTLGDLWRRRTSRTRQTAREQRDWLTEVTAPDAADRDVDLFAEVAPTA